MENFVFITYDFPVQVKTFLCSDYNYTSSMLEVPYFLLSVDEKVIVLNNQNKTGIALSDKSVPNLRIGSSHKPRTSQRDARYQGFKNVNVTSVASSPFSPLKGGLEATSFDGIHYKNFENWWQASKVFPDLKHIQGSKLTDKFFKWRRDWADSDEGHRILKFHLKTLDASEKSTGKSVRVAGFKPIGAYHDGQIVDYVKSRDYYMREYIKAIKNTSFFKTLLERVIAGENIMILDLDGPPVDKYPEGVPVTWSFIQDAMNDPSAPFGHGYVICALLTQEYYRRGL